MREMRKHVAWYTTGYPQSAKLRGKINEIESISDLQYLLEDYAKQFHNPVSAR